MPRSLIGPKIRDRRRALGATQAGLAARVGISASYLNLIEGNKRNIGGALLKRIAEALGLALEELDGAIERRLAGDLAEVAGEPLFASLRLDGASAGELASRNAPWAKAFITLHRSWLDRSRAVSALSDRLGHDPFLADAVHGMLTQVTAIRSSAEILESVHDLEPARRERFVAIIGEESRRLAEVARAMAEFFEPERSGTRSATPAEEVDDFLFERGNHFPAIERLAEALRAQLDPDAGERALRERLSRVHGIAIRDGERVAFDAQARTLELPHALPPASARFALARAAAQLADDGGAIVAEIAAAPQLASEGARRRAQRVLTAYAAAALLMPYERFAAEARGSRHDLDHLAHRFGASFEQVAHRLVTLRRPGAEGVPFGLMRVDPAGFVTKRFALPHLLLPRHANACPLWAVYQAFQSPGATVRQLAGFPTGDRFLFVARAIEKPRPSFAMPRRFQSLMLACDAVHADQTVYAEGIDLSSAAPAVPVGPNCRLCARRGCSYREEDPIIDA